MTDTTKHLDQIAACEFLDENFGLKVAPKSLQKARCIGGGPEFIRFGTRVYYTPDALLAWANARLTAPMRSTSDNEKSTVKPAAPE